MLLSSAQGAIIRCRPVAAAVRTCCLAAWLPSRGGALGVADRICRSLPGNPIACTTAGWRRCQQRVMQPVHLATTPPSGFVLRHRCRLEHPARSSRAGSTCVFVACRALRGMQLSRERLSLCSATGNAEAVRSERRQRPQRARGGECLPSPSASCIAINCAPLPNCTALEAV